MLPTLRTLLARPVFRFCVDHKQHALRITREMLTKYKELQPWKNIRMLYSITMAHHDLALPPQHLEIREDRVLIQQVLDELSNHLHEVPHKEINILMEVLKEHGITYDRTLAIYRALNKQAKMLFGRDMKAELLPRSLHYLKVLGFPKFTINKLLDELARTAGKSTVTKAENTVMQLSTKLQIAIFSMEQPFVTFSTLIRWLKIVLNSSANTLSALCYLYHLVKATDKCLQRKIEYQYEKTNARELLFNSYDEAEEIIPEQPKEQKKQPKKTKQQFEQQFEQVQVKQQLMDMSQQVVKMINQAVDVKNLQKSIVKTVQDNIEPYRKELVLYTCDIPELRSVVEQFLRDNVGSLTPVELIYLLKRCSRELVDTTLEQYLQQLGKHMSVEQKVYLYIESHRQFHRAVKKQHIFALLDEIETISYSEFMAITRLTELLPSTEQKHIGQVLHRIKSKMPQDQPSGASQSSKI